MPSLPDAPTRGYASLLGKALVLGVTTTLGTALSTASLERFARRSEDPDQELIANGLATVVAAFLGGVATTQLIARSAIGVRLGINGRRPALIQAFVVLGVGLATWRLIPLVPTAALTGVAIATAFPLLHSRPLRELARISRVELGLALLTAALIVLVGLIEGVVAGIAIGLMTATARIARTRAMLHKSRDPRAAHHLAFTGSITFLAALELEMLRVKLGALDPINGLVVDLRNVVAIDSSGADGLIAALDVIRSRDGKIALLGPSMAVREVLARADETAAHPAGVEPGSLSAAIAPNDREVDRLLGRERATLARPHLLVGLQRFRDQMREHYDSLFAHLADGQHPHTMFITCADSRVDPGLLMGSHPGDLFIVRCIGALMPPSGNDSMPQEGAALEYALGVLGVRNIVICGHSKCGAIAALKKAEVPAELASLVAWSKQATVVAGEVASFSDIDDAVRAVTVRQLENLRSYPLVHGKLAKGELQMHAWFYDLGAVELFEWDEAKKKFAVLGSEPRPTTLPPPKPADEPVELEPDNWPTRE
jgi:carbonic anhydrase